MRKADLSKLLNGRVHNHRGWKRYAETEATYQMLEMPSSPGGELEHNDVSSVKIRGTLIDPNGQMHTISRKHGACLKFAQKHNLEPSELSKVAW